MLTQERLKELLDYDPETGVFTWRGNKTGAQGRRTAGSASGNYYRITVDGKSYRAHWLAWLWMKGEFPKPFMDHVDGNKQNNKWSNLRLATKSQNMANRGAQKNTTSGLKGVWPYHAGASYGKPWQAGIAHEGKKYHLGHFETAQEAHEAYKAAAQKLFGEFGRAT